MSKRKTPLWVQVVAYLQTREYDEVITSADIAKAMKVSIKQLAPALGTAESRAYIAKDYDGWWAATGQKPEYIEGGWV